MDAQTHTDLLAARCRAIAADLEARGLTAPLEIIIRHVTRLPMTNNGSALR